MKAFLEFNLPEEKAEFEAASRGFDYRCQIDEIIEYLHKLCKYPLQAQTPEELLHDIRNVVYEIVGDED